jgi:site-specific DNA-methyltransferase (adenine-specific)
MDPHYRDDRATIYHGDAAEVIATLPDASVDCVVTSPPYAEQRATTYGGIPEADYPAWTVGWMDPLRRVLKPRGSVIINIRPHVKGGQIADYTLRTRLALREAGWLELDELIWFKPHAPPTGSPARPRRCWESLHWFGLTGDAYGDPTANGRPSKDIGMRPVGPTQRNGWNQYPGMESKEITEGVSRCMDVFEFGIRRPKAVEVGVWDHPAPYPKQVAAWCIRLVCPPNGTVLDPFSGSGSTGVAALQEGRRYVGIDLAEEYAAMSARRVAKEPLTLDIFGGAA